jgi:hypothetical protein
MAAGLQNEERIPGKEGLIQRISFGAFITNFSPLIQMLSAKKSTKGGRENQLSSENDQ